MIDVDIRNDDALSAHHEFFDILGGIVVFKGFWDLLGGQAASAANILFSFSLLLFPYIIVEIITQAFVIEKLLPSATSLTTSKYPTVTHPRGPRPWAAVRVLRRWSS